MLKAFDVSVGMFVRGLTNLKGMITKAEEHGARLDAKLADDMYTFAVQVHWAGEGAKLAVDRLLGITAAPLAEAGKTFAELRERLDKTIADLSAVDPEALEAGLARTIEIPHRGGLLSFRGDRFLTEFALPNFFFHLTTAYAILRHEGVPLQKGDFMGG
jgi:hypothetical protein